VIFDVVFFVVLASVLLQGTTIGLAATWLGIAEPPSEEPPPETPEVAEMVSDGAP
jgi:cell volume regulation protein A